MQTTPVYDIMKTAGNHLRFEETATFMNLSMQNSVINGFHGGKTLQVSIRSQPGTVSPSPGLYLLQPPMKDPIFGLYAQLVPAVQPGDSKVPTALVGATKPASDNPAKWDQNPNFTNLKGGAQMLCMLPQVGGATSSREAALTGGGAAAGLRERTAAIATMGTEMSGPIFVVSDRNIPGRNCLVVMTGFADLMDSLQAGGGVMIEVG